jgi:hypothetical protein
MNQRTLLYPHSIGEVLGVENGLFSVLHVWHFSDRKGKRSVPHFDLEKQ